MVQTSLTAWLRKPASVTAPPPPTSSLAVPVKRAAEEDAAASLPVKRDATSAYTPAVPAPSTLTAEASPPDAKEAKQKAFAVSTLPQLPPNVHLVPLTKDLLPAFKRLNSLMLPIAYPASFYRETVEDSVIGSITLVALWYDVPPTSPSSQAPQDLDPEPGTASKPHLIGAIRCRLFAEQSLYISTLSLLPPYRSLGIALHLFQRVQLTAIEKYGIKSVTAHVWESNEGALSWYEKRGFKEVGREDGYYRKLKPSGAVLMKKLIGPSDVLGVGMG